MTWDVGHVKNLQEDFDLDSFEINSSPASILSNRRLALYKSKYEHRP